MRGYFAAAARRGRGLVIASAENPGGRQARGYVGPMGGANLSDLRRHTHPGRVNQEKYVLITEPNAIVEGETRLTVTVDGKIYEVLRAEPVYVRGGIGHWEGVMRLKGGAADA